jgi:hypothetical protein
MASSGSADNAIDVGRLTYRLSDLVCEFLPDMSLKESPFRRK